MVLISAHTDAIQVMESLQRETVMVTSVRPCSLRPCARFAGNVFQILPGNCYPR